MSSGLHQRVICSDGPAPTAPRWAAVYSMAFVVAALITSEFLPVSLLTPIARDLHITEGVAGQMITVTSVFAVVTSLLAASVTRTLDRKVVLLAASVSLALSNVLVALAPNLTVLMLARVFLGLSMGGFWSLSNATTLRLVPSHALPRALAITASGVAIANVIAAPLGSLLGAALGWRSVFGLAALLGLGGFVWQWRCLPHLAPDRAIGRGTMIRLLGRRQVQIGLAAMLLTFGGYMTFFAYLRPFLEQVARLDVGGVSGVLFALGAAGIVGTGLSGWLLSWNARLTHTLIPLLISVLTLGLLFLGHMAPLAILLLVLWGMANSVLPVLWGNWTLQAVPDEPESAGGLQVAFIQFGMTLGAALGGLAQDHAGSSGVLVISGSALLLATVLIARGLTYRGLQSLPSEPGVTRQSRLSPGKAFRGTAALWARLLAALSRQTMRVTRAMNLVFKIEIQTLSAILIDSTATRDVLRPPLDDALGKSGTLTVTEVGCDERRADHRNQD